LSGRGLCDELITRPEESYRLCCVFVCDLETSRMGAPYIYDINHLRVNQSSDTGRKIKNSVISQHKVLRQYKKQILLPANVLRYTSFPSSPASSISSSSSSSFFSLARRSIFGSRPTRRRGFETIKFLRSFRVKHMPNLQNGNPGYLSFFRHIILCLPLVVLPAARLPPTQFCSLYTIQLQISHLCLRQKPTKKLRYLKNGNINKQERQFFQAIKTGNVCIT